MCKICGSEHGDKGFIAKDLMYHNKGDFSYKICEHCGCVWLDIIPDNIAEYYNNTSIAGGEGYGSFKSTKYSVLKRFLRKERNEYGILNKGMIGKLVHNRLPLPAAYTQIGKLNVGLEAKILDVGCGSGALIKSLKQIGFNNVKGIDAFIDCNQENEVLIEKYDMIAFDLEKNKTELYDLIMLHHCFEHIGNPYETLCSIYNRLLDKGICLITIPVAGFGLEMYRENWYSLCAPYHFFMYSLKSFKYLAEKSGFYINHIEYEDSYLWYGKSELYKKNINFKEKDFNLNDYFNNDEINKMKEISRKANLDNNGDDAIIVLRKRG